MADLGALTAAVERGDRKEATRLTAEAIDEGIPPGPILDAMTSAMAEVGRRFACGQGVYVPEMLVAARAMKESTALLQPLLVADGITPEHTVVMGTVKGDLHDIGKNLVAIMLEGGGFEIIDVGVDANADKFIDAINAKKPHIVALSALLTTTLPSMKNIIDRLSQAGVRSQVKVIIGGAPVTQDFADEIGADGYSDNAGAAVTLARRLLGLGFRLLATRGTQEFMEAAGLPVEWRAYPMGHNLCRPEIFDIAAWLRYHLALDPASNP